MKRRTTWVAVALAGVFTAAAAPALERQEIRVPDLEGLHTLKCDFHMHTVFSDGNVWPTWRVEEAWRDGLDAIALTDHIEYQPKKDDIPTRHMRPGELARGPGRQHDVIVIRGAEITKAVPPGHFNALFVTNIDALAHDDITACLEAARAQGCYVFWNHPGWRVKPGDPVILPLHAELQSKGLFQGLEIYNGEDLYTNAWPWALERNLTLLGNSDTHVPLDPPQPRNENHRTMTLVFARERTAEGIREALLARRTVVWYGPLLAGRKDALEPFVRACVTLAPPHHADAKNIWVHMRNTSDVSFALRRTGDAGPASIQLPAGKTVLLKIAAAPGTTAELAYVAENACTAPGEPLALSWNVKAP